MENLTQIDIINEYGYVATDEEVEILNNINQMRTELIDYWEIVKIKGGLNVNN